MIHTKQLTEAGIPLEEASEALILLHGRGAIAEDILSLRMELIVSNFYVVAPQANNNTWYPYSFMAPAHLNEPWLSSAIDLLNEIISDIIKGGILPEKIFLMGFSQGACLTLEFATRGARKWGGVIAFTGGLIGEVINHENYAGNFEGTKVFIGNSDHDPHVPLSRSEESKQVMESLSAEVTLKIYPGMPHIINDDEIEVVNNLFFL